MGVHLAAFQPRTGVKQAQPSPQAPPTLSDTWHHVVGYSWQFGSLPGQEAVVPSYKYKGRGLK